MKRMHCPVHRRAAWRGCIAALALIAAGAAPALPAGSLPDFTQLARNNSPAVVNISTTAERDDEDNEGPRLPPGFSIPNIPDDSPLNDFFRRFFDDQMPPGDMLPRSSLGSGFLVSPDGYVISNYHVVKDADEVVVRLSDRRELKAKIVGTDPRSDIAVLKVESDKPLPALKLGRSADLKVGEWVLAIGSPFGFDHSVTAGIVSATGRSLPNENYVPFIQTDVAINPGNSGGPLFNLDGEVVGVNSQIYSRTGGFMGLSFAIPIDVVMNVYQQIREKGEVSRGWLGVLIQDVTAELAESFHMKQPHGALVSKVLPDSPAENAGLEAGDIITKFNGQPIGTSSDLPPLVGAAPIDKKLPLEILRAGKSRSLAIEIGRLPAEEDMPVAQEEGKPPRTGIVDERLKAKVRDLTEAERKELSLTTAGVLVEEVKAGPAREAGLRPGDVLVQINFKEIKSAAALKDVTRALAAGDKVPVLVNRQGNPLFMALELPK
ncbi:MAG: DegQ family serine endoprotease [Gammaproteobacteria bacterium]